MGGLNVGGSVRTEDADVFVDGVVQCWEDVSIGWVRGVGIDGAEFGWVRWVDKGVGIENRIVRSVGEYCG